MMKHIFSFTLTALALIFMSSCSKSYEGKCVYNMHCIRAEFEYGKYVGKITDQDDEKYIIHLGGPYSHENIIVLRKELDPKISSGELILGECRE